MAFKKQAPTPTGLPELVVVSNNMRGDFYYPVSVPVSVTYQAYNHSCTPSYVPTAPGYAIMQTEWKQPRINPPLLVNVSAQLLIFLISGTQEQLRHARTFRRVQRDTLNHTK